MGPLLAGMDYGPLDFVAPFVCCVGSTFGGPVGLVLLMLVGWAVARRVRTREAAVLAGAGVGALLGATVFNVAFVLDTWGRKGVWRPTEAGYTEEKVKQVRGEVAGHVLCFTLGGGGVGSLPGMLVFSALYYRVRVAGPLPPAEPPEPGPPPPEPPAPGP